MANYIYSTHTNDVQYVEFEKNTSRNYSVIKRRFVVKGGHGMSDKHFITKEGVVTRVDRDDDLEWLMTLPSFQKHIEKGFIRVQKRKEDADKVVKRDMCNKDGSAPLTPADYVVVDAENHIYRSKNSFKAAGPV